MAELSIVQDLKQFILTTYLAGEDPSRLTSTTPLVSGGILDSLALLEVVRFLEDRLGVEFEANEVDPAQFETLATIEALIRRKQAA